MNINNQRFLFPRIRTVGSVLNWIFRLFRVISACASRIWHEIAGCGYNNYSGFCGYTSITISTSWFVSSLTSGDCPTNLKSCLISKAKSLLGICLKTILSPKLPICPAIFTTEARSSKWLFPKTHSISPANSRGSSADDSISILNVNGLTDDKRLVKKRSSPPFISRLSIDNPRQTTTPPHTDKITSSQNQGDSNNLISRLIYIFLISIPNLILLASLILIFFYHPKNQK